MKRPRKPLSRGRPPARRKSPIRKIRVKTSNPQRRKKSFARAYGGKERVRWVQTQPCCVAAYFAVHRDLVDNVHIETGGAGRKADANTVVPMCRDHHRLLHQMGRAAFEKRYNIDLGKLAQRTQARWLAFSGAQEQDA